MEIKSSDEMEVEGKTKYCDPPSESAHSAVKACFDG